MQGRCQALHEQWLDWNSLKQTWTAYNAARKPTDIDSHNAAQHQLAAPFADFFARLHQQQKALDKAIRAWERQQADANGGRRRQDKDMKALKAAMDTLHADMRDAEQCFQHIEWLQSRFTDARYEDVVGLCKAASLAEIEDQDWSLNPGRYVGVIIEEDGKTKEEFTSDLEGLTDELLGLEKTAASIVKAITSNIAQVLDR